MASRRNRRPQRELEFVELLDLAAIWQVYADDAFCVLYEQHRDEIWEFGAHRPGGRPMGYWMLEAPDDAPHPADHEDEDLNGFERAGFRWLAANDLLEDWEVEKLLNGTEAPDLAPHAREQAQLDAAAVLDGLAARVKTRGVTSGR